MSTKLCFNCFEKVDKSIQVCPTCSVSLTDETPKNFKRKEVDYDEEIEKLKFNDETEHRKRKYSEFQMEQDLKRIAILTSIIGLMQIYISGIVGQMNTILFAFDDDLQNFVPEWFFTLSGLFYILCVILLYFNFRVTRIVVALFNIFHIYLMYRISVIIGLIGLYLAYDGLYGLPPELIVFLKRSKVFSRLMFAFAFFYAFHTVYLFKRELSGIEYRRR